MTDKGHHVHFPEEKDVFGKDNEIQVQTSANEETLSVHLGFLQVNHRYEIIVDLPGHLGEHIVERDSKPGEMPSINCKIMEISKRLQGFQIKMELFAYKEKLIKELICLECIGSPHPFLQMILMARILGKGKGTPLLKNGVRCTGVELDDESEASDWQGFE